MTYSDIYALRICQLCKNRKITINKLATLAGLKQSTIDNIIRGKSRNPQVRTLHKIANVFGMTLSEFLDFPELNDYSIDDEEDDEYEFNNEEDLRNRLIEYERIKGITDSFKDLEDKRSEFYTKLPSDLSEFKQEEKLNYGENDIDDLINAFELFLSRQKLNKPLNTKIMKKELSVKERTNQIRNILKTKKSCHFEDLFEELTKPYVVVTFLSILEMAKNNEIFIKQDNNFGEISIEMK